MRKPRKKAQADIPTPKKKKKRVGVVSRKKYGKAASEEQSLYDPDFDEQVYKFCLLGATNKEIYEFFGIGETTLKQWRRRHPSFDEAIKRGKLQADANVASRLYERALGYSHPEEKIFQNAGEIIRAETTKHYPPDTSAAVQWLALRRRVVDKDDDTPVVWAANQKIEVSGPDGKPLEQQPNTFEIARQVAFLLASGVNADAADDEG